MGSLYRMKPVYTLPPERQYLIIRRQCKECLSMVVIDPENLRDRPYTCDSCKEKVYQDVFKERV